MHKNHQTQTHKAHLWAHRGFSSLAPENTYLAFETAALYGFKGVELDVHLTADQQLVIIHDETTNRTALHNKVVKNSKYEELNAFDYGAFFKIKSPKQGLLKLEDFLTIYLNRFDFINIEVKTDVTNYPGIENAIHNLLKNFPNEAKQKIIFSSFNFATLQNLHQLDAAYQLAFLFWKKSQLLMHDIKQIYRICSYLNPYVNLYEQNQAYYDTLELPFCLWTICSKQKYLKHVHNPKIFALISNYNY